MKILLLADGRSPTTRSWVRQVTLGGNEVILLSSYAAEKPDGVSAMHTLPLAFSRTSTANRGENPHKRLTALVQGARLALLSLRYYLGPISVLQAAPAYLRILDQVKPDMVHALRIPYEGMLAAHTPSGIPVVLSTWGNDFTLHAGGSFLMKDHARRAVLRADGFMADCLRDIRLAQAWGLRAGIPTQFVPGNGGVSFQQMGINPNEAPQLEDKTRDPWRVINPRGIRPAYVMNDVFFQAIPIILAQEPRVRLWGAGMAGQVDAGKWVKKLALDGRVELLAPESQEGLWGRFRQSSVLVSPAIHDGTPNSVLEGMALGCLPVVGRIESLEEWIEHGRNGLLVNPRDARSIADGILEGLRNRELQHRAAQINLELVHERADAEKNREIIAAFYQKIRNLS